MPFWAYENEGNQHVSIIGKRSLNPFNDPDGC